MKHLQLNGVNEIHSKMNIVSQNVSSSYDLSGLLSVLTQIVTLWQHEDVTLKRLSKYDTKLKSFRKMINSFQFPQFLLV